TQGALVDIEVDTGAVEVLQRSSTIQADPALISVAEHIEFATTGGATAHAYYYAPRHPEHTVPEDELPPLRVLSHGGPTASVSTALAWGIQYWTTRGFGVVAVDYGGSSGYGRAYRDRLNEQWGVVDVDDCINAARHLIAVGRADPRRIAICGGSAGGY